MFGDQPLNLGGRGRGGHRHEFGQGDPHVGGVFVGELQGRADPGVAIHSNQTLTV